MKLKLDENLSRQLKPTLQALSYDVMTAADESLLGHSDEVLGNAAKQEGRMILTLDLDFADIRKHPPGSHPGVILFRPSSLGPLSVNHMIGQFVENNNLQDFAGCLVVVDESRIRVRRPSSETDHTGA